MLRCPTCKTPHEINGAVTLANMLMHYAIRLRDMSDEEAREELRAQLRFLAAELDGYCSDHQWERAVIPSEEQIEEGRMHVCRIISIHQGRDEGPRGGAA